MKAQAFAESNHFSGIYAMGCSDEPKITHFGPGCRNQYIVHYVLQGVGYYNGSPVRAGQGFLIFPHQNEFYFPDNTEPWTFLWAIFTDDAAKDIFNQYDFDKRTNIFSFVPLPFYTETIDFLLQNDRKILPPLVLLEKFLHIFNSHAHRSLPPKKETNAELYVNFCRNYIEKNMHKQISVTELTSLLGVTQPYLYKIFHERHHVSVKRYITLTKHRYAKVLLSKSSLSVTEIANSTGYDDVLAFSKSFKAQEGISPTAYRKRENRA